MPRFSDIQGQDRAIDLLRRAAGADRLPHAMLFHGSKGTGKTSTAFALAQFLNCDAPSTDDSCGTCSSCKKIHSFQHPDVRWLFPMPGSLKGEKRAKHLRATMDERAAGGIHALTYPSAASIAIGRDEDTRAGSVAELRKQSQYAPVEARVKVFVVTEAERMRFEAANSLLKVLEEPPENNLLVLTTERPGDLLDTIVSRCQGLRFRDLSEPELTELLIARATISVPVAGKRKPESRPPNADEAALASALARGSLSRAAALVQENVVEVRDRALAFLALPPGDPRLHEAVKDLVSAGDRNLIERVLDFGLLWHSDLLRAATGTETPLANRDRESAVRQAATQISIPDIRRRTEALEEARNGLRGNVYLPLILHNLAQGLAGREAARMPVV